jgi:uncharacterized protein YgiB involved in biofilm formation
VKRSRKLRLTLLGAAPLVLSACNSQEDLTYESLDECIQDGKITAQACSTSWNKALQDHLAHSPRFVSQDACASEYGNCAVVQSGGNSFWFPLMAGFLAGRWSSHYGSSGRPYVDTYGDWAPRPLYRTGDDWDRGTWSSRGGGSYSERGSGWSGSRGWSSSGGGDPGRISTSTLSRGGFGGSSVARGGWGGGS